MKHHHFYAGIFRGAGSGYKLVGITFVSHAFSKADLGVQLNPLN